MTLTVRLTVPPYQHYDLEIYAKDWIYDPDAGPGVIPAYEEKLHATVKPGESLEILMWDSKDFRLKERLHGRPIENFLPVANNDASKLEAVA